MLRNSVAVLLACSSALLLIGRARAHVSAKLLGQGPAIAGKSYVVDFFVPHGCDGLDTYKIQVDLPESVNPEPPPGGDASPPRPMDNTFGKAVRTVNADRSSKIVWTRASDAEIKPEDDHLYVLRVQITIPSSAALTTVWFPVTQTCKTGSTEVVSLWTATDGGDHSHDAGAGTADAGTPAASPAPSLFVWPPRYPGWNKFTATDHLHDFKIFADALIVWVGDAAYSPNPTTMELIQNEDGVEVLDAIHPGTEFWVKY